MRHLLSAAATASLLLAQAPVLAEGTADDIGVMAVKLSDVVKSNFGIQAQTQGAGTPNEVGVGGFVPLSVGDNNVFYADVEANANLADFSGYSSIINTNVAGVTVSTSSRLGYRWLNSERSWMFGFNAGYDSRPMNTGDAKPYHHIQRRHQHHFYPSIKYAEDPQEVFFQQVAAEVEAVSSTWNFNAYALVPFGDIEQRLNSHYNGGALYTYGGDVGYSITPEIKASLGYYYQEGDLGEADGSGVKGRLAFAVADDVEFGGTYTYDNAFSARASADLTIRFGGGSHKEQSKEIAKVEELPQIEELSATPNNRDVRVHDAASMDKGPLFVGWKPMTPGCSTDDDGVPLHFCGNGEDSGGVKSDPETVRLHHAIRHAIPHPDPSTMIDHCAANEGFLPDKCMPYVKYIPFWKNHLHNPCDTRLCLNKPN